MKKRNIKLAVFSIKALPRQHQRRKIRKKGRSIRNIFQNTLFIFCQWNSDVVDNVTRRIRERAVVPNLPFFQNHVNLYFTIYIYKNLQTFGWKLKLLHVQCIRRTNVLAYPWAKTEDNLVAKHANCGSQGSPMYKTSYIKLWKFKQFSTRRRRRSEESTS